ncbi:hypothetical protein GGD81_001944 [Rhodobium orientis]|uniref:Putative DNA-binding domain-containing protein n=1 Tax=Rhodobium orientis TaxID=34017 RepID=A0A327JL28_9HYPH|nr:DNA-binding domain-containing protein [Rhodobium orientis]MBB4302906.1 hypothetical protein [Rhodobium orientis]MBK5949467.1 hypothetical protein [Rhodobium orientis]RAI26034.1 hypothetical protein CH339_15905 [Rhodobium orientis]
MEHDLAAALLDPEFPTPAGLGGWPERLAIHRNNVVSGLIDHLAAVFPATVRIVGEDFFRAAAGVFVRAEPPSSPLMFAYGSGFPAFLEGFPPAKSVAYLADVARLEWAVYDALHAADAAPLDPNALGRLPPERLDSVRFRFHPAARLIVSDYPVVALFRANRGPDAAGPLKLDAIGEGALVTRPRADVAVHAIAPATAAFLAALQDGAPLGAAAASGLEADPAFDLAASLSLILTSGAATALHFQE